MYEDFFHDPGQPYDDSRIDDIEHALQRSLPTAYKELIKHTGGGLLNEEHVLVPGNYAPTIDPHGAQVWTIFGNGVSERGDEVDLIAGQDIAKEWDITPEILYFADGQYGMPEYFAINYDLPEFPPLSVLYISEEDGIRVKVADTFEEFLDRLTESPEEPSDSKGPYSVPLQLEVYLTGEVNEYLQPALSEVPEENFEDVIRAAIIDVIQYRRSSFDIGLDEPSWRFLDIAFVLVTSSREVTELDSFRGHGEFSGRRIDDFPQIATVMFGFTVPGKTIAGPGSMDIVFTRWWEFRLKEGKIINTDQGYVLEPRYRAQLIDELREAPARQRLGFFKDYIAKFQDQRKTNLTRPNPHYSCH